ncbi:MAG: IS1182 family transposase, partial [Planctomycetota bacterium]
HRPPPKIRTVNRNQLVLRPANVDELIAEDHPARSIWEFVERLNLQKFYNSIASVQGEAGRSAFDPQMLISLWVYAYSRGIGSAREVSRLCETDPAFQWLTGFQSINPHTLSDFRVLHKEGLDELFEQVLGLLSAVGLIKLERVMQDGTKVQANASPRTFRKKNTIEKHLEAAREQVAAMGDPSQEPKEQTKSEARKRSAARERAKRVERALNEVEKIRGDKRGKSKKDPPKASTTDPEARMMKHNHGGILPSFNVQLSVDSKEKMIVGVEVTNSENDSGQLLPAIQRLKQTFNSTPCQVIADGDYTNYQSVEAVAELKVDYYSSWKQISKKTTFKWRGISEAFYPDNFHFDFERDIYVCPMGKTLVYRTTINHSNGTKSRLYRATVDDCAACPHNIQCCPRSLPNGQGRAICRLMVPETVTLFKEKMQTEEAKKIYRERSEVAEFPNLWFKTKIKLQKFYLRGLAKVAREAKWAALAYNIHQYLRLRPPTAELEATI